jgi:hypothetical protein
MKLLYDHTPTRGVTQMMSVGNADFGTGDYIAVGDDLTILGLPWWLAAIGGYFAYTKVYKPYIAKKARKSKPSKKERRKKRKAKRQAQTEDSLLATYG